MNGHAAKRRAESALRGRKNERGSKVSSGPDENVPILR